GVVLEAALDARAAVLGLVEDQLGLGRLALGHTASAWGLGRRSEWMVGVTSSWPVTAAVMSAWRYSQSLSIIACTRWERESMRRSSLSMCETISSCSANGGTTIETVRRNSQVSAARVLPPPALWSRNH